MRTTPSHLRRQQDGGEVAEHAQLSDMGAPFKSFAKVGRAVGGGDLSLCFHNYDEATCGKALKR